MVFWYLLTITAPVMVFSLLGMYLIGRDDHPVRVKAVRKKFSKGTYFVHVSNEGRSLRRVDFDFMGYTGSSSLPETTHLRPGESRVLSYTPCLADSHPDGVRMTWKTGLKRRSDMVLLPSPEE